MLSSCLILVFLPIGLAEVEWSRLDGLIPKEYLKVIENTKLMRENSTVYSAMEGLTMAMVDSMGHLLNAKQILLEEFLNCSCTGKVNLQVAKVIGPLDAEDLRDGARRVEQTSAKLADRFARGQACSGAALCNELLKEDQKRLLSGQDDAGYQTALWQDVLVRIAPDIFKPVMEDHHYKRILNSYLNMLVTFNSAEDTPVTQPSSGFIYQTADPPRLEASTLNSSLSEDFKKSNSGIITNL